MTQRTVVILTEPEQCERADPNMLVQAVLQLQQLNAAGLAASQAFCDHPAAAMKFIEAYAKAYPELQLRSSDLPPPEALYSIVAEGGVRPLQMPAPPDGARPGEVGQLHPLFVLSLGAPDALMRALQHNSFAKRDIRVVEIVPAEPASEGPVSVAEAVAHEPARSSWHAEGLSDPDHDEDGSLASDVSASDDSVKLFSVEVNLDHIQVERKQDQRDEGGANEVTDAPAVVPSPSGTGAQAEPGGVGAATGANGVTAAEPATQATLIGPVAETGAPSPNAAVEAPPESKALEPASGATSSFEEATEQLAAPEKSDAARAETDSAAGRKAENAPLDDADALSEPEPETATAASEDPAASACHCSDDSGDDVLYPPTGSFAMVADVTYPVPAGLSLSGAMFDDVLGDSGSCDVVDLEALCRLTATAPPPPDLVFEQPRDAAGEGGADPSPNVNDGATCAATPDPDEDPASQERLPASHDLDI